MARSFTEIQGKLAGLKCSICNFGPCEYKRSMTQCLVPKEPDGRFRLEGKPKEQTQSASESQEAEPG